MARISRTNVPFEILLADQIFCEVDLKNIKSTLIGSNWHECRDRHYNIWRHKGDYSSTSLQVFEDVGSRIASLFGKLLATNLEYDGFIAHCYRRDSAIQAHSDADPKKCDQVYRVIFNINDGWHPNNGGVWVFSKTKALKEPRKIMIPANNSAYMFRPDNNTYHALSRVMSGTFYTIVFQLLLIDMD